jgi:hypothetical protein
MALAWTDIGSAAGALCDAPSLALSKAISFLSVERSMGTFTTHTYALFHVFDSRATHARTLLPAALASVPFGFVLVRVRVRVRVRVTRITVASMSAEMLCALPLVTGWRLCFLDVLSVRVLPTPIGLCLFYGTIVRSCAWPSFVFLRRMITLLSKRRGLGQWLAPLYHNSAWRTPNLSLCSLSSLSLLP